MIGAYVLVGLVFLPTLWFAWVVNKFGVVAQARVIVKMHKRVRELEEEAKHLQFKLYLEQKLVRKLGGDPLFPQVDASEPPET